MGLTSSDMDKRELALDVKDDRKVIVDGLRNMEEFDYFKTRFPDLVLIGIHTDNLSIPYFCHLYRY